MNNYQLIPHAKLSANKLVIYDELVGYIRKKNNTSFTPTDNYRLNYSGTMSKSANKKIKKIIDMWLCCLETKKYTSRKNNDWLRYQITFCTLTLPSAQIHCDKEIKRECLNNFIIELKRKTNIKTYLCVSEKQDNKNIHFHILFSGFIDWKLIRNTWNNCIAKLGYIDTYRKNQNEFHKDGFKLRTELIDKWSEVKQLLAYKKGLAENWTNPNSTDIHALDKIKNIGAYVTKYICKGIDIKFADELKKYDLTVLSENDVKELQKNVFDKLKEHYKIKGKVWSCSENLEKLNTCDFIIDSDLDLAIRDLVYGNNADVYKGDCFIVAKGNVLKELKNKSPSYYNNFLEIQNINYKLLY